MAAADDTRVMLMRVPPTSKIAAKGLPVTVRTMLMRVSPVAPTSKIAAKGLPVTVRTML